ncbi:hypothetical protein ACLKA7_010913 [Drosophila subpalustris]
MSIPISSLLPPLTRLLCERNNNKQVTSLIRCFRLIDCSHVSISPIESFIVAVCVSRRNSFINKCETGVVRLQQQRRHHSLHQPE